MLLVSVAVPVGSAHAQANEPAGGLIGDFAQRIEDSWGLVVDPADYEIRTDSRGVDLIVRKDAPANVGTSVVTSTRNSTSEEQVVHEKMSLGEASPPTPAEIQRQVRNGLTTAEDDLTWFEPHCYSRLEDEDEAGFMTHAVSGESSTTPVTSRRG